MSQWEDTIKKPIRIECVSDGKQDAEKWSWELSKSARGSVKEEDREGLTEKVTFEPRAERGEGSVCEEALQEISQVKGRGKAKAFGWETPGVFEEHPGGPGWLSRVWTKGKQDKSRSRENRILQWGVFGVRLQLPVSNEHTFTNVSQTMRWWDLKEWRPGISGYEHVNFKMHFIYANGDVKEGVSYQERCSG